MILKYLFFALLEIKILHSVGYILQSSNAVLNANSILIGFEDFIFIEYWQFRLLTGKKRSNKNWIRGACIKI